MRTQSRLAIVIVAFLGSALILMILVPNSWWPWLTRTVPAAVNPGRLMTLAKSPAPSTDRPPDRRDSPFVNKKERPRSVKPVQVLSAQSGNPAADLPVEPEPAVVKEVASAPKRWPFPVAPAVRSGEPIGDVLSTFGQPAARVISNDGGRIREQLIYIEPRTGSITFIFLVDARVVSIQTQRR
jgi:hypothetical protein